ncbi:hypothetical protein K431DRAFT_304191 [Polychaeton citri CBS 116435]|uniref:Uncharacterized protein n=1 Tax=Polychaeton citri CBS 116435 TaxID=1314669 RepID=A0A9P4Q6Q5_9PEZI|nr:hypothetical protein K431DRAFT_304191 [Polychaeton citri CBS 116435]
MNYSPLTLPKDVHRDWVLHSLIPMDPRRPLPSLSQATQALRSTSSHGSGIDWLMSSTGTPEPVPVSSQTLASNSSSEAAPVLEPPKPPIQTPPATPDAPASQQPRGASTDGDHDLWPKGITPVLLRFLRTSVPMDAFGRVPSAALDNFLDRVVEIERCYGAGAAGCSPVCSRLYSQAGRRPPVGAFGPGGEFIVFTPGDDDDDIVRQKIVRLTRQLFLLSFECCDLSRARRQDMEGEEGIREGREWYEMY